MSRLASLLANTRNNFVIVLHVRQRYSMMVAKTLPIEHSGRRCRSHFCPLTSFRNAACFASASENNLVYVYDTTKSTTAVNKLSGHLGPVLDVSWNTDESLLASSDSTGVVMIWRRAKFEELEDAHGSGSQSLVFEGYSDSPCTSS
eukprot:NODE_2308_length_947_cov_34.928731_g1898_i0.p3 GENE.NODE_2308_length_947_cov_34.928731_g1898_i0~~NODE_2308_length_947_cov_34.928731_g1898_i0.p3  ORF type:complete len:146 (+),score=30.59 NODE_2308_length_947_cov_34.928731_g1898_i0:271-708(+)